MVRRLQLKRFPRSSKLFITLLLCVAGFCYLALLGSIWNDTQMKIPLIVEAYGTMAQSELVEHTFRYMFWFLGIFTLTGFLFLMSSYSEKIKTSFAVLIPLLILTDIASAWLIGRQEAFARLMFASGFSLACLFLTMVVLILYELWFQKTRDSGA